MPTGPKPGALLVRTVRLLPLAVRCDDAADSLYTSFKTPCSRMNAMVAPAIDPVLEGLKPSSIMTVGFMRHSRWNKSSA